jgi:hypothetical protein
MSNEPDDEKQWNEFWWRVLSSAKSCWERDVLRESKAHLKMVYFEIVDGKREVK